MSYKGIKELCMAGACHRGISYIGALQYLEEESLLDHTKLEKVIGVSIGSFVGACYLAGFKPMEFMETIVKYDTSNLKDISIMDSFSGLSILRGSAFRNWIHETLSEKIDPDITMKEFHEKTGVHFTVIVTCIEDGAVYIDHENEPDFLLYDALVSSMNFPFVFPPYVVKGKSYVDGGVLNNFPMHMLSQEAVGFKVNFEQIDNIENPFSYIGKLFELICKDRRSFRESPSRNIVQIEASDFSLIDFDMSTDDKMTLYKRGYNAAKKSSVNSYFKDWKKDFSEILLALTTPEEISVTESLIPRKSTISVKSDDNEDVSLKPDCKQQQLPDQN